MSTNHLHVWLDAGIAVAAALLVGLAILAYTDGGRA